MAFLHLIIDPACSIVLEAEPAEARVMQRPPRNPKEPYNISYSSKGCLRNIKNRDISTS